MTVGSKLKIKELTPTFGAEVAGIDFSGPVPNDVFDEFKAAMEKYGVVVVRKTALTDESLIEFGQRFGELDNVKVHKASGFMLRLESDQIFDVSNINEKDQIIDGKDLKHQASANGNALWHADGSFNNRRTGFSMLRAVELPPPGTGGETEFLDCRTAYEDLPEEKKEEIKDYVGLHSIYWNRKIANYHIPQYRDLEPLDYPMARHKVALVHEPTGRPTLFVTSYTHSIEGLPVEEGQKILKELSDHVAQEKYKLTVNYESPGDLVIWDNTSVLHRALKDGSYVGKYRRDMRRISTFDTSSYEYGLNQKKQEWQGDTT